MQSKMTKENRDRKSSFNIYPNIVIELIKPKKYKKFSE
jgi:hypothetical protein